MKHFKLLIPATIFSILNITQGYASQSKVPTVERNISFPMPDKSYAMNADYYKLTDSAIKLNRRISYLNWLDKNYSWQEIKAQKLYRVGDSGLEIQLIKSRLKLLGDSVHRHSNSPFFRNQWHLR